MTKPCERCGSHGGRITSGPFAGDYVGVGYCAFCSADLCRSCMASGTCLQDGERRPHREADTERELRAALAAEREAHHKALDAYATLLREVDAERARADAGASACEVGLRNQLGLERELTAARADLAAAEREADRWRHGLPVEGDYVCPTAQERDAAIARAEAAERQCAAWAESGTEMTTALARVSEALGEGGDGSVTLLDVHERVRALRERTEAAERERDDLRARLLSEVDASRASIASLGALVESTAARAEVAEGERDAVTRDLVESESNVARNLGAFATVERRLTAERDAFRAQAEASLVVPCACGRLMPSVQSRLRCDACRAEGERDEARARLAALVEIVTHDVDRVLSWRQARASGGQHVGTGGVLGSASPSVLGYLRRMARDVADVGAPLLAEVRALRAVRDAASACVKAEKDARYIRHELWLTRDEQAAYGALRAALDAAKAGG